MKNTIDLRKDIFAYPITYQKDGKMTSCELHFGKHVIILNEDQIKEIKGVKHV